MEHAGEGEREGVEARVRAVEEAVGFTEHTLDRLAEAVRDLDARVRAMLARVERMERRLDRLAQGEPPGEGADDEGAADGPS